MISSMVIFGTIGLFVRNITAPSAIIALFRAVIGTAFLLLVVAIRKKPISISSIKRNAALLWLSGICIGFNWILLFEAYRYTSIAIATLCYYMAPIFVLILSPFMLKEKLSIKKTLCILVALVGMVCVSGVLGSSVPTQGELKGIVLGLSAASLYAAVILMNKQLNQIEAYDKTIIQLGVCGLVLIPYCFFTYQPGSIVFTATTCALLLLVGVVHTGLAYFLYFGSMSHLTGQSIAIISYTDPVVAVIVSILLLNEHLEIFDLLGALLILGAALLCELPGKKKEKQP